MLSRVRVNILLQMPSFVEKQVTLSDGSQVVVEHDNEIM